MKAVIMAGGNGTRLRPVSSDMPKPMVPLFSKPVIEHTLDLLHESGIRDVCMTLRYLPESISSYFGDGSDFDMSITYRIEEEPLGTAGGVRACADFIGDDDFIVISGDAVCSYDIQKYYNFHKSKNAQATLVLAHRTEPTEYGLVVVDANGAIRGFVEKPSYSGVITDLVNTGVYFLTPQVLELIPADVPCDFAQDVFPRMLTEKRPLFACVADGIWHDIGSPDSYLTCHKDILRYGLSHICAPERRSGIYSIDALPEAVHFIPPCYIGKNVSISPGATIGPNTVLGDGCSVGIGSRIEESVLYNAHVSDNCSLHRAVLCRGSRADSGCELRNGSVIGADAIIGRGSIITDGVKIFPGCSVADGSIVFEDIRSNTGQDNMRFSADVIIRVPSENLSLPSQCHKLGLRCAGIAKNIGVAFSGGNISRICSDSFTSGANCGGADVLYTDSAFPAEAAYAAALYSLPLTLFIARDHDGISLWFFSSQGLAPSRSIQRSIENSDVVLQPWTQTGSLSKVFSLKSAYITAASSCAAFPGQNNHKDPVSVCVRGHGAAARSLKSVLSDLGCIITDPGRGSAEFTVSNGGFSLTAIDERGNFISSEKLLALLVFLELENGSGKAAVPFLAPAVLDDIADSCGKPLLRLDRDEGAAELYAKQFYFRHAIFAAGRIAAAMALRGETLSSLVGRLPTFATGERELRVNKERASLMRSLSQNSSESASDFLHGLTLSLDLGRVNIAPGPQPGSLLIRSEASNTESAAELCSNIEKLIQRFDS